MAVHKKFAKGGSVLGRGLDEIGNGRGLDALIDTSDVHTQGSSNLNEIDIHQIVPNPNQPRREFDEEAMEELATSIREMGIITPITLRQMPDGKYQIIAGERRWRASQKAGLKTLPAYIRTVEDESVMEMALVENIQREDLNAIEIALAYQHLLETTGMTQAKISDRVGKSRTAVLDSPTLQIKLFKDIQKNNYSVRKVEEIVQLLKSGHDPLSVKQRVTGKSTLSKEHEELKKKLSDLFQTKVQVSCSPRGKGKISIPFSNEEELEHISALLSQMKA